MNNPFCIICNYLYEKNGRTSKYCCFLNQTVKTVIDFFQVCLKTIMITCLPSFKNISIIDRNNILVHYKYCGKSYIIPSKIKRGPYSSKLKMIQNEKNQDVSLQIIPYLGPNEDWHCQHYTPKYFGHKTMKIHLNQKEQVVEVNENDALPNINIL